MNKPVTYYKYTQQVHKKKQLARATKTKKKGDKTRTMLGQKTSLTRAKKSHLPLSCRARVAFSLCQARPRGNHLRRQREVQHRLPELARATTQVYTLFYYLGCFFLCVSLTDSDSLNLKVDVNLPRIGAFSFLFCVV